MGPIFSIDGMFSALSALTTSFISIDWIGSERL
jgi:hypothetical protein